MRISWRNLDWISEADQAEVVRQIESWSIGECGLDRVDFVASEHTPRSPNGAAAAHVPAGDPNAAAVSAASMVRTRILGRIGKAQVTVVRDAASEAESFRAAFMAFEDSSRWTLEQVRSSKMRARPEGATGGRSAARGRDSLSGDSRRGLRLPGFKVPSLSVPKLSLPSLPWPQRSPRPAPTRAKRRGDTRKRRSARNVQRTSRSASRRGVRGGAVRWGRRAIPFAAAIAGFALVGSSPLDPLAWVEVRFSEQAPLELAFSATAELQMAGIPPQARSGKAVAAQSQAWAYRAIAGSMDVARLSQASTSNASSEGRSSEERGWLLEADARESEPVRSASVRRAIVEPRAALRIKTGMETAMETAEDLAAPDAGVAYWAIAGDTPSDGSEFPSDLLSYSASAGPR